MLGSNKEKKFAYISDRFGTTQLPQKETHLEVCSLSSLLYTDTGASVNYLVHILALGTRVCVKGTRLLPPHLKVTHMPALG